LLFQAGETHSSSSKLISCWIECTRDIQSCYRSLVDKLTNEVNDMTNQFRLSATQRLSVLSMVGHEIHNSLPSKQNLQKSYVKRVAQYGGFSMNLLFRG
jgi:hypothetical protein